MRSTSASILPRGKPWSLYENMRRFPLTLFSLHMVEIANWRKFHKNARSLSGKTREQWLFSFRHLRDEIASLDLVASLASADRILALFESVKVRNRVIAVLCTELMLRLNDELSFSHFLSLTPNEADIYDNPRKGWEPIITRFPDALADVEEARKCFALSRYAASVFHSCQIIEVGLVELGAFIGVKDPRSGWTAVANALEKILKKAHNDRTDFEQTHFAFLEQMHGTIEALKNAWRNKISHSQGKLVLLSKDFTPEITEEILIASRAFIRRLAEYLPRTQMTMNRSNWVLSLN